MVNWQISTDNDETCNIYKEWRLSVVDRDHGGFIRAGYEAIPQNLVINIFFGMIMFFIFTFGRKLVWNFGRIALMQRNELKYKEIPEKPPKKPGFSVEQDEHEWMYSPSQTPPTHLNDPEFQDENLNDEGAFDWIGITWRLTDEQIRYRSGQDALQYLSYQRHLIFLSLVMCLCSLLIIMPIHLQGRNLRYSREGAFNFQETTIANISPESPMLWIHVIVGFFYFILSLCVMRHFSRQIPMNSENELQKRTILLIGIKRDLCHIEKIQSHFEEIYPRSTCEEISFVYATSQLRRLEDRKWTELSSVVRFQKKVDETGKREKVWPFCCCAQFCFFLALGCGQKVDAIRHYVKTIRSLRRAADYERIRTLNAPLGLCFITFASLETAQRALWDYSVFCRFFPFLRSKTPRSQFSRKMQTDRWIAIPAPFLSDILWENFGLTLLGWYSKFLVINSSIIVVILIFSTPIIFIKSLESLLQFKDRSINQTRVTEQINFLIIFHDVMPIFIIFVAAVSLPSLVTVSDRAIGFWSRSSENRSRMIKTFTFLMIMVVVLPSLGISSFLYFVDAGHHRLKVECIFSPVNGAFYVNYVSTSCFVGVLADLNRFPELFLYIVRLAIAKSRADIVAVRYFCMWDFQMGTQYAWTIIVFAVFTIFSLTCPLIMPFGVLYLLLKHFVDRYNIFFAYGPCKVDKSVHGTAINFVIICMFLLQLVVLAFTNKATDKITYAEGESVFFPRHGLNPRLEWFVYSLFTITLILFLAQICFNACTTWTPFLNQNIELQPVSPPWLKVKSEETGMSAEDFYRRWDVRFPEPDPEYPYRIPKVLTQNQRRFFANIPRTIVTPDGMYWAPYLRKDFPFTFPARKWTMPSHHSFAAGRLKDRREALRKKIELKHGDEKDGNMDDEDYPTSNETQTINETGAASKGTRVSISIERNRFY